MKQELISYLSIIQEDIIKLAKYIYENPEQSYKEHKAYNCILKLLNAYNFQVQNQYLKIPTSFYAEYGNGYPKLCFLCQYDTTSKDGHIYGNNASTAISIGSAISLTKILGKIGSSVVVIGCPGSQNDGSLITMEKQGTFENVDAVFLVKPYTTTGQIKTSPASLPLKLVFEKQSENALKNCGKLSTLDCCLLAFNTINSLLKDNYLKCCISSVNIKGNNNLSEAEFTLLSSKMHICESIEDKTKKIIKTFSDAVNINAKLSLNNMTYKEFIPNDILTRLFFHNLKENGVIDEVNTLQIDYPLNIGNISHSVPCINPLINFAENDSITYPSKEFGECTVSNYGYEKLISSIKTLALTSIDLIEKKSLIKEAKNELLQKIKKC